MKSCFVITSAISLHNVFSKSGLLRTQLTKLPKTPLCPSLPPRSRTTGSSLRVRLPPSCHAPCHSSQSTRSRNAQDENDKFTQNPLTSWLIQVAQVQTSITAASISAALLALAALGHVIVVSSVFIRLSLLACFVLTGVPALADSTLRFFQSRGRTIDVNALMSLAAAVCIFTGAFFEGALLTTLYAVSHAVEDWMSSRARRELDALRELAPSVALRVKSPTASDPDTVPVNDVRVGDFLLVKTGEMLPCDGQVVSGSAFVSMQQMTGEPTPRHVHIGDNVPAGCRTEDASIVIEVTRIGAESYLARISRLVTAAQENRPRVSRLFERFGQLYARSVLSISFLIALLLPMLSQFFAPVVPAIQFFGRSGSVTRALGFLVVASPCALLVGAPIAYLAALSACARRGILAKSGARSLEAASLTTHVVFDKTGTLTTGKLTLDSAAMLPPNVQNASYTEEKRSHSANQVMHSACRLDELVELDTNHLSRVLSAAAALERGAVHPIATALCNRAKQLGAPFPSVSESTTIPGQGVEGILSYIDENGDFEMVSGKLGRASYILSMHDISMREIVEEAILRGEIVSVLEIGGDRYLFRLRDDVRPDSQQLVQELKQKGLNISILTGDNAGAARSVSDSVGGGAEVIANASPEKKLDYVRHLQLNLSRTKGGVLMIGDGINDAAALAASLLGVAFGLSSATAVHAADVVLVREELTNVSWFLNKAKATERIVFQNLGIALGLMVLSAIACVAGSIPLWLAVSLHEGGTVLVGINGLRLLSDR